MARSSAGRPAAPGRDSFPGSLWCLATKRNLGGHADGWRALARTAASQHGVASRDQLRACGLSEETIKQGLLSGRLHHLFRGTFALGHPGVGREGRLLAATLACGPGALVSHQSAAALLHLLEPWPAIVHVIAPVQIGRKIPGVRRHRVAVPGASELGTCDGIPCTSPSRTIVDLAGSLGARSLEGVIEEAAVAGVLDVSEIDAILAGPRRRGSRVLRAILEDWRRYQPGIRVRSRLEAKLLPLLTRRGLPVPLVNERLRLGAETYELDFLWPRERLVVETDGGRYHGHPLAQARDSDRNRALRSVGYEVRRLTWDDVVVRPAATMDEIAGLLPAGL